MPETNRRKSTLSCEAILQAALGDARPGKPGDGREKYRHCPHHDDQNESLKNNLDKNKWMCGPCGVGGGPWDLVAFLLGLGAKWELLAKADQAKTIAWLREKKLLAQHAGGRAKTEDIPIRTEYLYRGKDDAPLARRTRHETEEKDERFKWWHPGKEGEWLKNCSFVADLPLYVGLPEPRDRETFLSQLEKIEEASEILLCEGEHDADAGAALGFLTVTSGSSSQVANLKRNRKFLRDLNVTIIAHLDPSGLRFAQEAAAILDGEANRISIVTMPDILPAAGVKDLADVVEKYGKDTPPEAMRNILELRFRELPEWKQPGLAEALDGVYEQLAMNYTAPEPVLVVVALFSALTYVFKHWRFVPFLHICSPEPGCGKSTLAELMLNFVCKPARFGGYTEAALFRYIEREHPTLFLEELDAIFTGKTEKCEAMRGLMNCAFQRGFPFLRCSGKREDDNKDETFEPFCPIVFCMIGSRLVPVTVRLRSIEILLQKCKVKTRYRETPEKLSAMQAAGARLAAAMQSAEDEIPSAPRPYTPDFPEARQLDLIEGMLTVGELAGERWAKLGRMALWSLLSGSDPSKESPPVRLLSDLKSVFYPVDDNGERTQVLERVGSVAMTCALGKMENSPWPTFGGRYKCPACQLPHISPAHVVRLLADFRYGDNQKIVPRPIWIDGVQVHCYELVQFEDAWKIYEKDDLKSDLSAKSCENANSVDPSPQRVNTGSTLQDIGNKHTYSICGAVDPKSPYSTMREPYKVVRMDEWRSLWDQWRDIYGGGSEISGPRSGGPSIELGGPTAEPVTGFVRENTMLDRSSCENTVLKPQRERR